MCPMLSVTADGNKYRSIASFYITLICCVSSSIRHHPVFFSRFVYTFHRLPEGSLIILKVFNILGLKFMQLKQRIVLLYISELIS